MNSIHPILDPATHYRIEIKGRVDVEWLQSFDSGAKICLAGTGQVEGLTVLEVHTDQSGIVGLVRRLHGLGMMILQLQVVFEGEKTV